MKAFITPSGILNVIPESETEEYAVIQWKRHATVRVDDIENFEETYYLGRCISIPEDISFKRT